MGQHTITDIIKFARVFAGQTGEETLTIPCLLEVLLENHDFCDYLKILNVNPKKLKRHIKRNNRNQFERAIKNGFDPQRPNKDLPNSYYLDLLLKAAKDFAIARTGCDEYNINILDIAFTIGTSDQLPFVESCRIKTNHIEKQARCFIFVHYGAKLLKNATINWFKKQRVTYDPINDPESIEMHQRAYLLNDCGFNTKPKATIQTDPRFNPNILETQFKIDLYSVYLDHDIKFPFNISKSPHIESWHENRSRELADTSCCSLNSNFLLNPACNVFVGNEYCTPYESNRCQPVTEEFCKHTPGLEEKYTFKGWDKNKDIDDVLSDPLLQLIRLALPELSFLDDPTNLMHEMKIKQIKDRIESLTAHLESVSVTDEERKKLDETLKNLKKHVKSLEDKVRTNNDDKNKRQDGAPPLADDSENIIVHGNMLGQHLKAMQFMLSNQIFIKPPFLKDLEDEDEGKKKGEEQIRFTTELTKLARDNKLDPLIGREKEIEQCIHTLLKRKKNNPILVGPPGCGKTAIVNGLACKIANKEVPEALQSTRIFSLDLNGLVAGCRYRGDFEERMSRLIESLKNIKNSVLFIDEFHSTLGAGDREAGLDFINIIKPYLSEGTISIIGATTHEDFRRTIERDRAIIRRLQRINVAEPTEDEVLQIVKGIAPVYEEHHQVKFNEDAIVELVKMASKYIPSPSNPDKSISLLDDIGALPTAFPEKYKTNVIDIEIVRKAVAQAANMPHLKSMKAEREKFRNLERDLNRVVFGQQEAIAELSRIIILRQAGLQRHDRPAANLLFAGPTGVGKTELAKQTAKLLGVPFVRFDMSEYKDGASITKFIGASPGYVGYERGGILTNAVVENPNCVLLLDEIEKADYQIFDTLLQVMDAGRLSDNTGRIAYFNNVILIMTSNIGSRSYDQSRLGFERQTPEDLSQYWNEKELKKTFTPEFRNRLDKVIVFNHLKPENIDSVIEKFIHEAEEQSHEQSINIELTQEAKLLLAKLGYDPKMGARPLDRIIQEKIKTPIARELLFGELQDGGAAFVDVIPNSEEFDIKYTSKKNSKKASPKKSGRKSTKTEDPESKSTTKATKGRKKSKNQEPKEPQADQNPDSE